VYRDAVHFIMIRNFQHKGLEVFYRKGSTRGIQASHAPKLLRILAALETASAPNDMNLPGYKLHSLKGQEKGIWSVWVNGNWRVTFRFTRTDVELINYLDYH